MNRIEKPTTDQRRGFTLVELLVVIAIIGVLIGLLLPAIQMARVSAQKAQTATEISQLSAAIADAKSQMEGCRYVPSSIAGTQDFTQFFGSRFMTANIPGFATSMNGNQCLVFFLGGYNTASSYGTPYTQGFSTYSPNPFSGTQPMRPPFFNFPVARLAPSSNGGPPSFLDIWGNPYTYNTTRNATGDYDSVNPVSYDATGKPQNFATFQITSQGPPVRGANPYPHPLMNW